MNNQQSQHSDKTELLRRLIALQDGIKIRANGREFVKCGTSHLMTESGALTLSDFTKYFSDFDLINDDNK